LQARYTDDHPDVIKTKADIAELKKKLAEINEGIRASADAGNDKPRPTSRRRFVNCACRFTSTGC
jgi:uncharacterized protein involved in exopolysaccharide biosynthesis